MSRSSRMIDQPAELFHFDHQTYDRVTGEFEDSERRFRCLQVAGNGAAKELASMAAEIDGYIWRLWSAVYM